MNTSNNALLLSKDLSEFGQILAIELSPYVLSQDLILLGFANRIILAHLKTDEEELDIEILHEFRTNFRCTRLSISAEDSVSVLPNNSILFAASGTDNDLRIFKSDSESDGYKILRGHTGCINDIKFNYDNTFLVSVSDDCSARLWEVGKDFTEYHSFRLKSPGMVACWHREYPLRLLIAEKSGIVRFYNIEMRKAIRSLNAEKMLSGAHWASFDSQLVASLQLGELLIWHLSKYWAPVVSNVIFTEIGGDVKFSPFGELVAVVNARDGNLKVVHAHNQQLQLSAAVTLPTNIAWHCRLPIVCIGDYMKLKFWKVTSK